MRRPEDNTTPAELVKESNEEFPHFKMRLGTKEDLRGLGLLISFSPKSMRSKRNMQPGKSRKRSQPSEFDLSLHKQNEESLQELLSERRESTSPENKEKPSQAPITEPV